MSSQGTDSNGKGRKRPLSSFAPYVGETVAKMFPGFGLFVGEVVEYRQDARGGAWRVRYEDGEYEELLEEELLQCRQLYHESQETITALRSIRLGGNAAPPPPPPSRSTLLQSARSPQRALAGLAAPPPPRPPSRPPVVQPTTSSRPIQAPSGTSRPRPAPSSTSRRGRVAARPIRYRDEDDDEDGSEGESEDEGEMNGFEDEHAAVMPPNRRRPTGKAIDSDPDATESEEEQDEEDETESEEEDEEEEEEEEEEQETEEEEEDDDDIDVRRKAKRGRRPAKASPRRTSAGNLGGGEEGASADGLNQCPDCLVRFISNSGYRYHVDGRVCHKPPGRYAAARPEGTVCPVCKCKAANNACLLYHLRNTPKCWTEWGGTNPIRNKVIPRRASAAQSAAKPVNRFINFTGVSDFKSFQATRRQKDATLALAVPEIGGVLELRNLTKGTQAAGLEPGDLSFVKHLVQDMARQLETPQSQPRLPLSTWLEQAQVQVGPIAAHVVPRTRGDAPHAMLLPPFRGMAAGTGRDLLVNACGPVYGLDCLSTHGGAVVYAAIGVSSLAASASSLSDLDLMRGVEGAPRLHIVGERVTTPNLVQIWRMPAVFSGGQPGAEGCAMTFAIGHRLGPVWDLRWAPDDTLLYDDNDRRVAHIIGLLAAVMGDGQLRIYAVPEPEADAEADAEGEAPEPYVLTALRPMCMTRTRENLNLTVVRWCPTDPAVLICGATDGSVLLYRLEMEGCVMQDPPAADAAASAWDQPPARLVPLKRFFDSKTQGPAGSVAVTDLGWCPADPQLFAVTGRDTSLRVWHTRDPFRPVSERLTSRGASCLTWLPHGLACLAGMSTGDVRIVGWPDDVFKVRFYMHETEGWDAVTSIDMCMFEDLDAIFVVSTGQDGRARLLFLDDEDLFRRKGAERGSYLSTCMALTPLASEPPGQLGVNLREEAMGPTMDPRNVGGEEGKSGKILSTMRSSLTKVRCLYIRQERQQQPREGGKLANGVVVCTGGFAGLVRFRFLVKADLVTK